jgi:hypothetical protein
MIEVEEKSVMVRMIEAADSMTEKSLRSRLPDAAESYAAAACHFAEGAAALWKAHTDSLVRVGDYSEENGDVS